MLILNERKLLASLGFQEKEISPSTKEHCLVVERALAENSHGKTKADAAGRYWGSKKYRAEGEL